MRKARSKDRSSLSRPTKTGKSGTQIYSPSANDSFSQIPRAVGQSYDTDFFITNTQRKTTNFFQPAESEEQYGRIMPSSVKKSSKHDQPIIDQEANHKIWRFFAAINDRSSQNQDETDEPSNGISLASRKQSQRQQNQLRIIPNANDSQVSDIRERPSPAPTSDKTQEINQYDHKNRMQRIHCLQTFTKVMDLRISPKTIQPLIETMIKPNLKIENSRIPFHKRHRPRISQKKREKESQQRQFIPMNIIDVIEEESQQSLYPRRKTRMSPLRYWLGQRMVYGKEGVKGKWILKK